MTNRNTPILFQSWRLRFSSLWFRTAAGGGKIIVIHLSKEVKRLHVIL